MSVLARRQIREAVKAVLTVLTGVTVESPGDWDTPPGKLPNIKLRCGTERKQSVTKSMPEFTTTVTLEVLARVVASTDVDAQDQIEALGQIIEQAILGAPAFIKILQQVSSITTVTEITSEGQRHLAGIQMLIDCEVFESFDPTEINPSAYPALQEMLIHVDTAKPFDATGTYAAPPFPDSVTPAPRTSGPDGRDEGTLQIDLT